MYKGYFNMHESTKGDLSSGDSAEGKTRDRNKASSGDSDRDSALIQARVTKETGNRQASRLFRKNEKRKIKRLVEEAKRGNSKAISKIIELHYEDVLYFAISKVGKQEGEDVAQRAIENIIDGIGTLEDSSKLKAWMLTITNRRCMDFLREKMKHPDDLMIDGEHEESIVDRIEDDDKEFIPEEAFLNKELRGIVLEVINTLPENYADCIRLKYAEDLSTTEIAGVLETNSGKVKNDLYHGKKLFKERFEQRTGKEYQVKAFSIGATPLLTQIFQADCAEVITPAMSERVLDAAHSYLVSKATSASSASAATGTAKGFAVSAVKVVSGLALTSAVVVGGADFVSNTWQGESDTNIAPLIAGEEHQINTLADMIGAENAELLAQYETQGVESGTWAGYLQEIGATEMERATEPDYVYRMYQLEKQDKQLVLYVQESLSSGDCRVLYTFGQQADLPYMLEVLLMFS